MSPTPAYELAIDEALDQLEGLEGLCMAVLNAAKSGETAEVIDTAKSIVAKAQKTRSTLQSLALILRPTTGARSS